MQDQGFVNWLLFALLKHLETIRAHIVVGVTTDTARTFTVTVESSSPGLVVKSVPIMVLSWILAH